MIRGREIVTDLRGQILRKWLIVVVFVAEDGHDGLLVGFADLVERVAARCSAVAAGAGESGGSH